MVFIKQTDEEPMSADLYPLTLEPIVAALIWARPGEASQENEALPDNFFGTLLMADGNSRVAAGPQAGRSLAYLRQEWGPKLVGIESGGDYDGPLPVELKLKRTGDFALAVGLTEDSVWHFLSAGEDSSINAGFNPGLELKAAAQEAGRDPGLWSEFMPEYAVEPGQGLLLPRFCPMILGAGLSVAQIGPPARALPQWPLAGSNSEGLRLSSHSQAPAWLPEAMPEAGRTALFRSPSLKISLIVASHFSSVVNPDAATFLWPVFGRGRVRTRGPAPVTRLDQGKVLMLPAALGRYAVESGGLVGYLLIEAF